MPVSTLNQIKFFYVNWATCVPLFISVSNEVYQWSFHWLMRSFCSFLETTVKQIEDAFKEFTTKEDIAIILISQYVSVSFTMTFNNFFSAPLLLSMQVNLNMLIHQHFMFSYGTGGFLMGQKGK